MIKIDVEDFDIIEEKNNVKTIKLPELTEAEKEIINPIVAPTSGLRIQLYNIVKEDKYLLTKKKLFLFLITRSSIIL